MGRSSILCYMAVLLLSLHGLPTPSHADEFTDTRVTIQINVDNRGKWCSRHFGKPHRPCTGVFNLRLPRFLPTNETRGNVFRRTWEDTCGLFDILVGQYLGAGEGPPPHVHYADEEWFFPWGEGSVRMYAGQKSIKYLPGQVPGFNAPITVPGSASIKKGDILYSPVGVVHWFSAEDKGVYNFIQVHAYGYAMPKIIAAGGNPEIFNDDRRFLEYTGLWGIPHDKSGKMVGMKNLTSNTEWPPVEGTYRSATGPVKLFDPDLKRLQKMFDDSERCYPRK